MLAESEPHHAYNCHAYRTKKKTCRSKILIRYRHNVDLQSRFTMSITISTCVDQKIDLLNLMDVNMVSIRYRLTINSTMMSIWIKNRFNIVECTICCRFKMSNTLSSYNVEIGSVFSTLACGVDFQQKIDIAPDCTRNCSMSTRCRTDLTSPLLLEIMRNEVSKLLS